MEELIKSLPKVLRTQEDSAELHEAAALVAWKHAIGEGLRPHAIARKLVAKTLTVAVRDAIWQKQLDMMKSHLLFRVNSILGQPLVDNIELIVDSDSLKVVTPEPRADRSTEIEVPMELWSAASNIDDRQLRQKFLRAASVALKRREG